MSERKDLTRWNRAGRSRFRYVDGKAVEYLEILRQQIVDKFKDPKSEKCQWLNPSEEVPANEVKAETETLIQRQERLSRTRDRILEMYHQDRRDWAWEITRTFARACHILTEHTNAYANEGYLGTATQWDNVRRLVEMLDYHPAPPASAFTPLMFVAKDNKAGIVNRGFQVKYTPAAGGAKVIFETLEDLFIDPALNELRPKGWDQLGEPALTPDNNGNNKPSLEERQYSPVANGPAITLQGVGEIWADQLDTLPGYSNNNHFSIKDFLDLDPEDSGIDISKVSSEHAVGVNWLKEFKATATVISNFELESGWSNISGRMLPDIASESPDSLAEITGNPLDKVKALQLRIELIGAYLDHGVYENTELKSLLVPTGSSGAGGKPESVPTSWRAKRKPKVVPGQVAMVHREFRDESKDIYVDEAAAATIAFIDKQTDFIHLAHGPEQNSWSQWEKSEARLKVLPRWKRKCWLNNDTIDVVRTEKAHGLSKGSFICWKNTEKVWEYAKIVEADNRDLRLKVTRSLPQKGAEIVIASPFEGDKMAAEYKAIVLLNEGEDITDTGSIVTSVTPELAAPDHLKNTPFKAKKIFPIVLTPGGSGGGGGLLPPASLPKIGTFLFPSPMLPMDLVKAAVEMMLSFGVMQIPSTEEFVLKGLPFGGMLEGAGDVADAAEKLVNLLDNLALPAMWQDGYLVDLVEKPIYLELTCGDDDGQLFPSNANAQYVYSDGKPLPVNQTLKCLGGKVVGLQDKPVGYQPRYTDLGIASKPVDSLVHLKMIEWDMTKWDNSLNPETNKNNEIKKLLKSANGDSTTLFKTITKIIKKTSTVDGSEIMVDVFGPLLAVLEENPHVQAIVQASDPLYMFNGSSKIEAGDWVVGRFTDGLRALKVSAINEDVDGDKFSISFENLIGNEVELQKIYADFRGELITDETEVNITPIDPKKIELEDVPQSLKIGRTVLLTGCGNKPVAAKIDSIDGNVITTKPPAEGCAIGNLIIRGNVVLAGHGEGKPEKILGSGNAAKSNQEFTLEVEKVSFMPDATKSSGVAAAIEVEVDGRVWKQVSTLKDSAPDDRHYVIRMTEEGYVKILFGDGQYGRRLPSGKNNIRVRYRVGSGLAGNVPEGGLEKPVNLHPLIEAVRQPVQAAGGGDMEDVASLRENAPSSLLALERAVSLSDFSHLAAAQSSVWQAKAYSQILRGGRSESVKVVIVPASGVTSDKIKSDIEKFLQKHALPGVQVDVMDFKSVLFDLKVTVRVKSDEFNIDAVEKAVTVALSDHFTLRNRKLGGHLYLSEVYKVVESIPGVENSICMLNGDERRRVIKAEDEQSVVYLDTNADKSPSTLIVAYEEYQP